MGTSTSGLALPTVDETQANGYGVFRAKQTADGRNKPVTSAEVDSVKKGAIVSLLPNRSQRRQAVRKERPMNNRPVTRGRVRYRFKADRRNDYIPAACRFGTK